MKTRNISLAEQLDEVLKKNIDAQKGYAKASENAESTYLQDFFLRKSNERKSFNDELRTALRTAYGTIENEGSLKGTLHRTWMDIKNMFSADSDEAMLEECLRGDKAVKTYPFSDSSKLNNLLFSLGLAPMKIL